jgi:Flp pilus assembly protein TadB
MSDDDEALRDLTVRTRQLEAHLLGSPEYLARGQRGLRRQVGMLYLAIALLFVFEGFFVLLEGHHMPAWLLALIIFTSLLAIVNCVLLIHTRRCLHDLNERWLTSDVKKRLETLRREHAEMQSRRSNPSETR